MTTKSPFHQVDPNNWQSITKRLIQKHPLSIHELRDVVLHSWDDIFLSNIGRKPYFMGKDIAPKPQILGFFLHELISLEFENRYPNTWVRERNAKDKDMVYLPNELFSIEIKTSSNPTSIFGNRSYAQVTENEKKLKSGYYLAINFEKIISSEKKPKILKIRFGWLDHDDWVGQASQTGQQSRLSRDVENGKLIEIFSIHC